MVYHYIRCILLPGVDFCVHFQSGELASLRQALYSCISVTFSARNKRKNRHSHDKLLNHERLYDFYLPQQYFWLQVSMLLDGGILP